MGGKEKWGDWKTGKRRGERGKVSTYIDGMLPSFLLNLACFAMSDIV